MSDTPELSRLVVLHGAILVAMLDGTADRADPGFAEVLKEADALTLRIAHRARSAIDYHKTSRGLAALDDAEQLRARQQGDELYTELVDRTWTPEQMAGPIMPGMEPERRLTRRHFARGMRFLSDPSTQLGENHADDQEKGDRDDQQRARDREVPVRGRRRRNH